MASSRDSKRKKERISTAKAFLSRGRKDYKGYESVVGQQFMRYGGPIPRDPALAIYLLQQANEKAIKAVAIASGLFTPIQLMTPPYGHNSLALYSDFFQKILKLSTTGNLINLWNLSLSPTGKTIGNTDEAIQKLQQLKDNTKRNRQPNSPNWFDDFALLAPDQMSQVLQIFFKLHKITTSGVFQLLKPAFLISRENVQNYLDNPTLEQFQRLMSPAFRNHPPMDAARFALELPKLATGLDFESLLMQALQQEKKAASSTKSGKVKRDSIEKELTAGFAFTSLLFLTAITFPHENSTRYPAVKKASTTSKCTTHNLGCADYTSKLGIVYNLHDVGKLTKITLDEISPFLETASIFSSLK
ncbi:MAG: hypothetical protein U9N44_07920 [Chloroflexota bacterium]|nr:hypothetical protein [Chloroflexota bacterium]